MKYQFCIRFKNIDANSAASKAVLDCNRIFSAHGYEDYTFTVGDNSARLKYYGYLLKELILFFMAVKPNSIIGIQYPLLSINDVFKHFMKIARWKGAKFFCVIHDLESLRTGGKDKAKIEREVANLNEYDSIIVHNKFMLNWLIENGVVKKMISLELFDYLSDDFRVEIDPVEKNTIVYAGNLNKSVFIYDLPGIKNRQFSLYGPGLQMDLLSRSNLQWMGQYSPEEIPKKLKGGFGLIWDGSHIDKCDEILGNYLRYNNPHKCSLYIAAGLPVIAPADSAIGAFIKKHHIGILVDSLPELDSINLDDTDYSLMSQNVLQLREKVIKGNFFAEAIKSVEQQLPFNMDSKSMDRSQSKPNYLYVFGGEKAQGAEIVIERLMSHNTDSVTPHLIMSPGTFADKLIKDNKPYSITLLPDLKKLNRSVTSGKKFYFKAISNYFTISRSIHQYIKEHDISVVHANTVVPASYLLPLIAYARLFNKKLKWLWSDHDITYFSKLENHLAASCANLYDYTLVVSEAVKNKYNGHKKVQVLYNGLDLNVFKADDDTRSRFRRQHSLTDNLTIFGMPAVVHPRKGQLELIEAFKVLSSKHANIHLLLAGGFEGSTPDYTEKVKVAITGNPSISHLGYVDKMTDFYNGCDVIVNNSDITGSEPLGTTIYEAMACEKIVIASITGGTPEIITDKVDGYLFEAENIADLTAKLIYIVEQNDNLGPVKSAAREKVKAKFDIKGMIKHYNSLFTNN